MINNISFKGYIPVKCYARNEGESGVYKRLYGDYLRTCQNKIVRNLNGTLKEPDKDFINFYALCDKDYKRSPHTASVFDDRVTYAYMVTGEDSYKLREFGREKGCAQADSKLHYGTFESKIASRNYFQKVHNFLKNSCKKVKDANGNNLTLKVYFDAQRYKRGEHSGDVKDFKIAGARFVIDE